MTEIKDMTTKEWISEVHRRQTIELKANKGTAIGFYLEILGETMAQLFDKNLTLITTIESQKDEIEKLREIQRALVLTPMQRASEAIDALEAQKRLSHE